MLCPLAWLSVLGAAPFFEKKQNNTLTNTFSIVGIRRVSSAAEADARVDDPLTMRIAVVLWC